MKYFPYYVKVDGNWLLDDKVITLDDDEAVALDGKTISRAYQAVFDDLDGAKAYNKVDLLSIVKKYPNCEIYNDKYRRLSDPQVKELLKEPEDLIKWGRRHGYDKGL